MRFAFSADDGSTKLKRIYKVLKDTLYLPCCQGSGGRGASKVMPDKKGKTDAKASVFGAGDEARTRYLHLGKVALYQMSYTRMGSVNKMYYSRF